MVDIPLYIFLFVYFIFLAIFAAFYIMIVYHIVESASFTLASFMISFFIFAATVLTLYGVIELLSRVNWQETALTLDMSFLMSLFE